MPEAPQRMFLANLWSGDTLSAQYNPDQVRRVVKVSYEKLKVLGQSHNVAQFQWRENEAITFDLAFDRLSLDEGQTDADIKKAERLLDAMTLSSRNGQDINEGGPPDILLFWPDWMLLVTRIEQISYDYLRFEPTGAPTFFRASIACFEILEARLFAEDVVANGLERARIGDGNA